MTDSKRPDRCSDTASNRRSGQHNILNNLNGSDVTNETGDDVSFIDQLAQQLKENPSATFIPRPPSFCMEFSKRPYGDDSSNDDKDCLMEDSSNDNSSIIDNLVQQLKENPAATFMKDFVQCSSVENSPRSNSPPLYRRRSSVSIEARVETDDDALSMSLSPQSENGPSVPSSPLITIEEKCMITNDGNELIQEEHQQSILSPEESEVFESPASTSGSFFSIPRSETPWTVSTTPAPVHPFNEIDVKPSVAMSCVGELGKSDEDMPLVLDENEGDVISPPDIRLCDVTLNERCVLIVHKAQANCPLCETDLPVACLRIDIKTGDVSVDCSQCPATIVMKALYNTKRVI